MRYCHAAKIIQKAWKQYLAERYKYLGLANLDDCDPASLAEIRLIPKIDLYIWYDNYRRPRGGNLFEFLKWISRSTYLEIPTHYTREKLQSHEIEWLIQHSRHVIKTKLFSRNSEENQQLKSDWHDCVNLIDQTHQDRLNPLRVYFRLKNHRDRAVGELVTLHQPWIYLITMEDLEKYLQSKPCSKPSSNISPDLQKTIQAFPLKTLFEFQELWAKLDYIQTEIKKFEQIFNP